VSRIQCWALSNWWQGAAFVASFSASACQLCSSTHLGGSIQHLLLSGTSRQVSIWPKLLALWVVSGPVSVGSGGCTDGNLQHIRVERGCKPSRGIAPFSSSTYSQTRTPKPKCRSRPSPRPSPGGLPSPAHKGSPSSSSPQMIPEGARQDWPSPSVRPRTRKPTRNCSWSWKTTWGAEGDCAGVSRGQQRSGAIPKLCPQRTGAAYPRYVVLRCPRSAS